MKGVVESLQPVEKQIIGVIGWKVEPHPGCPNELKFDPVDKLYEDKGWEVSGWWAKMNIIALCCRKGHPDWQDLDLCTVQAVTTPCAQKIVGGEECGFTQSCPDCSVEALQKPRYGLRLPLCPMLC